MLTSAGNQYLRPEYLNPLPTTMDAKKSPLALLAQTCSAIGADSPNPKLISAAEKASLKSNHKYTDSIRDKSPVVGHTPSESKASFKPYESCLTAREKTRTPEDRHSVSSRVKSPSSSKGSVTPVQVRCGSNQSSSSQRNSPTNTRKTPSVKSSDRRSPAQDSPTNLSKSADIQNSASKPEFKETTSSSFKPSQSTPVTSSAYLGGLPPSAFPLPMDLMTSGLLAAQHNALKNGLNPYLAYARMKAPNGSDMCRDPYCTGCSLSSHLMNGIKSGAPCPAGCVQCDHSKTPFSLSGGHSAAAAAYAHAHLAAMAAASQLPFVCSWMAGDSAYCGKRFPTSDELLQHLRTHTSTVGESNSTLSMLGSAGLPPTHPLLQRSYPTPPLSPLTPRFHPYSKPSHLMTSSSLPFPLPPHPSLAAYFSPYPLFGPRSLHP